jgi:16S rRNA (guanine(1405)-N(7))-methyltransferase
VTGPIVERVLRSSRYRDVAPALVERLATEELPRARTADDAVKRVKRRLHQAVGAFRAAGARDALASVRVAWTGDLASAELRAACVDVMRTHASTAERLGSLDALYSAIWAHTGVPSSVLDIGCGLHPLALPWMGIGDARYHASDVDGRALDTVDAFLSLVGQEHFLERASATDGAPSTAADVAFLLKLVPTLDRQDPTAAARLLSGLRTRHAVVSFPKRSLGGRGRGMERTYRARLATLADGVARVVEVAEVSVPSELVFVLTLDA